MELIINSLQRFLKNIKVEFHSFPSEETMKNLGGKTSTNFYIMRSSSNCVLEVIINVAPKEKVIYFNVVPWMQLSIKYLNKYKRFEKSWNNAGNYSTLEITNNKEDQKITFISFLLKSKILTEVNGLTRSMWNRYLELFLKETEQVIKSFEDVENITITNLHAKKGDINKSSQPPILN